ncbi:hypothetical protein HFD88_004488 [Aspergillus terreus]|nr:hypothetical protein HFD88_004488 [Aspergillus terreus]
MHAMRALSVLAGVAAHVMGVHARADGTACRRAVEKETGCEGRSADCFCPYLEKAHIHVSDWTWGLCDEAGISIKTLYHDVCEEHPFFFPQRSSAPMRLLLLSIIIGVVSCLPLRYPQVLL